MHKDVSGVRIIPEKIAFLDTHVNTSYTKTITVKNVSNTSKSIRYYAPQTSVSIKFYGCFGSLRSSD